MNRATYGVSSTGTIEGWCAGPRAGVLLDGVAFLAHADRGMTVRPVPLTDLADAVEGDADVVAFSAVQPLARQVADVDVAADAARQARCALRSPSTTTSTTSTRLWRHAGVGSPSGVVAWHAWGLAEGGRI